jgi:hypothetical protein
MEQRTGEVADTDKRDPPFAVDSQSAADGSCQLRRLVTDARLPQIAKVGEILANLCVRYAERLSEEPAGNLGGAIAEKGFEAAQIEAQSTDAGP